MALTAPLAPPAHPLLHTSQLPPQNDEERRSMIVRRIERQDL